MDTGLDPVVEHIMKNFGEEYQKWKNRDSNSMIQNFFAKNGVTKFQEIESKEKAIIIGNAQGDFVNGPGLIQFADGTVYAGNLVNSQRHGFGIRNYRGVSVVYMGDYQNDKKSGLGKLYDMQKKKRVFEGHWSKDMKNGHGVLEGDKGTYVGNYLDDKMSGQGTMTLINGDKYEGNFQNDLKEGQGKYWFNNGDNYIGMFSMGLMHGQGTYTWKNGQAYNGMFSNGAVLQTGSRVGSITQPMQ